MSFFVDRADLTRIVFEDGPCRGAYMMVRTALSYVETQRLGMAGFGVELTEDGKPRPVVDSDALSSSEARRMEAWIKGWNFPKRAGAVPGPEWRPTANDFESLTVAAAQQVLQKLEEHERAVRAEEALEEGPLVGESLTPPTLPASDGTTDEPATSMTS